MTIATDSSAAVAARYGDPAAGPLAVWNETLAIQLAHRSVRQFLDEDVTQGQLTAIVAAAQSAPTSSNLQSWSVVAVRSPERRHRLAALAGQPVIDRAPLLLVWLADVGRAARLAGRRGSGADAVGTLEITLTSFVDAAIAAQNAVVAIESIGLGSVYIGAIRNRPVEVAEVLGLPPHTAAVVGMAVGVPDPSEPADVKPRLPQEVVLHHEAYTTEDQDLLAAYDDRLATYNARFGLDGTWSDRVLGRLRLSGLAGRDRIREALARLGLPSR